MRSRSRGFGLISEPRRDWVVESRARTIPLAVEEEAALRKAGEKLARRTNRFGEFDPESTSSLIHCSRVDADRCSVRVAEAVGVVATPTLVLEVRPKIPQEHLLFLFSEARLTPNFLRDRAHLQRDRTLPEIIAQWFVFALERLLEQGLARDYREHREEIPHVRGRIAPLETASLYYRGHLSVVAEFEEFDFDTPLNRVLREAARKVLSTTIFDRPLRDRASRALARMDGVSDMQVADLRIQPDRRTGNYGDAWMLARQVIDATGLSLAADSDPVWTFLIRTPDPVEAGLRAVLRRSLPEPLVPRKAAIPLPGSSMTINPDLVFGDDIAVADVKYKVTGDEWIRADLYEVIAFSVAVETETAAIIGFRPPGTKGLDPVQVGAVSVHHLDWPADPDDDPELAAAKLSGTVADWLIAPEMPAEVH